ncbi:MAG: PEP-CTERM sorting domain-containing protein [Tepidisphaerales bacterium]
MVDLAKVDGIGTITVDAGGSLTAVSMAQGSLNVSGSVNDADVTIVGTYYQGASPPAFASQSSAFAQAFMAGCDSSHGGGTSAVPEPGALSLLGLGALALIRRKRRA